MSRSQDFYRLELPKKKGLFAQQNLKVTRIFTKDVSAKISEFGAGK
jgi:hypothetical protein